MQNLILEGLQQKLQKSCSRCNKNTQHIESSYILQPLKYLLLLVNRFRYINNNITKDRCPIPMDTTVRLGPLKFSLQATIDHHGLSIDSGHYTASINCCKKNPFYCNDHNITEFGITDKTPLLHILYYINGLAHGFGIRTGRWEFDRSHGAGTFSPSHWQQVEEQTPKPVAIFSIVIELIAISPQGQVMVNTVELGFYCHSFDYHYNHHHQYHYYCLYYYHYRYVYYQYRHQGTSGYPNLAIGMGYSFPGDTQSTIAQQPSFASACF